MWGYDTERPGKGLPLARPQGTEEKGIVPLRNQMHLVPFLQKSLAHKPPRRKGAEWGF